MKLHLLNRIKILFILIILVALSSNVFAQRVKSLNLRNADQVPYHFGFQLGVNRMFFSLKTNPGFQKRMYYNTVFGSEGKDAVPDLNLDSANLFGIESNPTYGFVIGIIADMKLWQYFNIRFTPSLTFGERDLIYNIQAFSGTAAPQLLVAKKNIQSTFVEFPLSFKFKGSRINNTRPYVLVGAKYALDLASNAKKKEDSNIVHVFIDRNDVYAHLGVGFDFYTAYFKFGTEVVMSYGILDLIKRDHTIYTDAISSMQSKIFQINFTFEGD
ncbi:MAG: hypothetical protein HXX13_11565 [Bacteroidetes bacterium]|nr:hypothetical protein [Bacteroidota bacterium]